MSDEIRELSIAVALVDVKLLVEDVKALRDGLITRSQIVDSQILAQKQLQEDMENTIRQLRDEMVQFRADRQLCARLNLIIAPVDTDTKEPQKNDSDDEDISKKLSDWN
jgi:hypothetical protein